MAGSVSSGWGALTLERSPSTSLHGSAKLHWICSTALLGVMIKRPLPTCSRRRRISSSTCSPKARSYSPVCNTARAVDTASPPPFSSTASKNGRLTTRYEELISARTISPGLKSTTRYGPVPTGLKLEGASRDIEPWYGSKRWRGISIPALPQNGSAQNGVGFGKTTLTAWSCSFSTRLRSRYSPTLVAAVAGSAEYCQLKTTSSALKGLPSCQVTPFLRFQITQVPSFARPPLSTLGMSAARIGTRFPSASKLASGSWNSRAAVVSLSPVDRCGFSTVGACQLSKRRVPPPPRRVGVNAGPLDCARAMPLDASIRAAIGAVTPTRIISCSHARRLSRPASTSSISSRSACSSTTPLTRARCPALSCGETPCRAGPRPTRTRP